MNKYRLLLAITAGLCFASCPETTTAREPEPLPIEIALRVTFVQRNISSSGLSWREMDSLFRARQSTNAG